MDMKPHLIIDIRDRSMFSLLMDEKGNIHPCTHNVMEYSLRYFFGEIFLDIKEFDKLHKKNKLDFIKNCDRNNYDIIRIGEKLGWKWPYQLKNGDSALPVKHPLNVLSSIFYSDSNKLEKKFLLTCQAMMEFLLEPIFRFIKSTDWDLPGINGIVIIPGYFNRYSQLLLYSILRRKKLHSVRLIPREIATMMNCLEVSSLDKASVLDMENEDTHLYQVELKQSPDEVEIRCPGCFHLRDFGWYTLVRLFSEALYQEKLIDEKAGHYWPTINRTLMALIYGIDSTRVSSATSLKITHGLFDELFVKPKKKTKEKNISKLTDWISRVQNNDNILIPIGLSFMMGQFESSVLSSLKSPQLPKILSIRSLERSAYGMASGLNWLRQEPGRKIKISNPFTLRMATGHEESIELVPHSALPTEPGEQRIIRQVLDFRLDETVTEDMVHVHLLWGINPNPRYNVNVCLLSLNVTKDDVQNKRKIRMELDLKRSARGNSLSGTVTLQLAEQSETAQFNMGKDLIELSSQDIT
jgi:hypothetical protein